MADVTDSGEEVGTASGTGLKIGAIVCMVVAVAIIIACIIMKATGGSGEGKDADCVGPHCSEAAEHAASAAMAAATAAQAAANDAKVACSGAGCQGLRYDNSKGPAGPDNGAAEVDSTITNEDIRAPANVDKLPDGFRYLNGILIGPDNKPAQGANGPVRQGDTAAIAIAIRQPTAQSVVDSTSWMTSPVYTQAGSDATHKITAAAANSLQDVAKAAHELRVTQQDHVKGLSDEIQKREQEIARKMHLGGAHGDGPQSSSAEDRIAKNVDKFMAIRKQVNDIHSRKQKRQSAADKRKKANKQGDGKDADGKKSRDHGSKSGYDFGDNKAGDTPQMVRTPSGHLVNIKDYKNAEKRRQRQRGTVPGGRVNGGVKGPADQHKHPGLRDDNKGAFSNSQALTNQIKATDTAKRVAGEAVKRAQDAASQLGLVTMRNQELQKKIAAMQAHDKLLKDQNSKLQAAAASSAQKAQKLIDALKKANAKDADGRSNIAGLQKELAEERRKQAQAELEAARKMKALQVLSDKKASLAAEAQKQLAHAAEAVGQIQMKAKGLKDKNEQLNGKINNLSVLNGQLRGNLGNLRSSAHRLKLRWQRTMNEAKIAQRDVYRTRRQLRDSVISDAMAQKEIQRLNQEQDTLLANIHKIKNRQDESRLSLEALVLGLRKKNKELQQLIDGKIMAMARAAGTLVSGAKAAQGAREGYRASAK